MYVVEWSAVRDSNQPSVRKSGQGLFASQIAHCLRICGQRGKNGRMVINRRDLIGWLGPLGAGVCSGTWIGTTDQDQHGPWLGFTAL